ncbi:MAG: extracellular solute-binding protein [Rhodobacter sp.]|nr:extracellular solute-binding protein [Cupriavidus sp.]MCA3515194.1 extracellular solute-binding protein [Rhodobacter sp.]
MFTPKLKSLAIGALAVCVAAPALAQQVTLAHDKAFWEPGWAATGAEAGFTPTAYPTDQYVGFIQSSVAAGTQPGLFTWWSGRALDDLAASGGIAPVDDIWNKAIADGQFSEGLRALFSVDGKAYALPVNVARWVVIYNKEIFAKNGLSEPATWEEFESAMATLKAAGVTPINATVQDGWRGFIWFQELMLRTNPEAYNALHTGKLAYDSPEVKAVFDIWTDWASKGYFSDPRSTTEAADFAGGNAAMYLMGEWVIGGLKEAGMDVDNNLGVFLMPNRDPAMGSTLIVEGGPLVLSAKATDADRAAFEYWATEKAGNTWANSMQLFNGNLNVEPPNPVVGEVTAEMADKGTVAYQRWWEAVPTEIRGDLVAELSSFVLNPTGDQAKESMANMQALNAEYWANQ